jgi:hypothetical protein
VAVFGEDGRRTGARRATANDDDFVIAIHVHDNG